MLVQPAWIAHLLCRPASKGDATGGWADWQVGKPGKRKGGRGEGVAGLATTFEWSCDFGDGTGIGWFDGRLRRGYPPGICAQSLRSMRLISGLRFSKELRSVRTQRPVSLSLLFYGSEGNCYATVRCR